MSKTVLFDLVFLTPRQKVRFGPRTQNDDFLGTRPWARAKKTHRFSSSVRNYYFLSQGRVSGKALFKFYVAMEPPTADGIFSKTNEAKTKAFTLALEVASNKLRKISEPEEPEEIGLFALSQPLFLTAITVGTPLGDSFGLTEEDVHLICESDPEPLKRYGYTPAHLLCKLSPTTSRMSLLRYFINCDKESLTRTEFPLLHIGCKNEHLTEELLGFLVQVDPSQANCIGSGIDDYCKPLELLCQNVCCNERLMGCLLEVDSRVDVVGRSINRCLQHSKDYSSALEKIDILLKANPRVVKEYRDDFYDWDGNSSRNWLHRLAVSRMPPALCIDIMKRILAIHPVAVKEVDQVDDGGSLPIHDAAQYGRIEVMKFLENVFPGSASVRCPAYGVADNNNNDEDEDDGGLENVGGVLYEPDGLNLLHLVLHDLRCDEDALAKVKFLCTQYPEMLSHRSFNGTTPFHTVLMSRTTTAQFGNKVGSAAMIPMVRLMCEIGGGSALATMSTVSRNVGDPCNGWLPLHYFINHFSDLLNSSSLFSEATDLFHLMLQWYPEAAGIEAGNGLDYRKTPYQLAVDKNLATYYLRFLLRAAPDFNPAELHRLNYAERRMAMFLAFSAVSSASKPLLLSQLRHVNMDLVRLVVSFL